MQWESHLVHAVAMAAVHTIGRRQHGIVSAVRLARRVGRWFPALSGDEAAVCAGRLRAGTCLTRAIAVSSRLPGSQVVIGVRGAAASRAGLVGHAWVEQDGIPVRPSDPDGDEIARFA